MTPAKHFAVLKPLQFLEDVEYEAKSAKKRIWGQAMEVEPGEFVNRLLHLIEKGAERGLDARLNVDHYSLITTDGVPNFISLLFRDSSKERLKLRKKSFDHVIEKGARIFFVNPPSLIENFIVTMGRNHMKIFVVDDIAWIGGVNFGDGYFKRQDFMVKITDKAIVDPIAKVFQENSEEKLTFDEILKTKHDAALLIDSGNTGKSVILDAAVQLVNKARHSVRVATAFIPDDPLLSSLIAADRRGAHVTLAVPAPGKTMGLFRLVNEYSKLQLRLRQARFSIFYEKVPIHAKVLIVDEAVALFGSHNFLKKGVMMRTGELAMQSTDKTLLKNLLHFYSSIVEK